MRIGLVGAGGTGKSTLAKLLAPALGLELKPSVSREVFQKRGLTEADQFRMTPEERLDLQKEILAAKAYQDRYHGKNVVFDRTPVDHLTYLLFRGSSVLSDEDMLELEGTIKSWMKDYTYVIYMPVYAWVFGARADGFRQDGRAYLQTIDALIFGLLTKLGVSFWIAPESDPVALCESIVTHIRLKERERTCNQLVAGRDREEAGEVPRGTASQNQPPAEASGE